MTSEIFVRLVEVLGPIAAICIIGAWTFATNSRAQTVLQSKQMNAANVAHEKLDVANKRYIELLERDLTKCRELLKSEREKANEEINTSIDSPGVLADDTDSVSANGGTDPAG